MKDAQCSYKSILLEDWQIWKMHQWVVLVLGEINLTSDAQTKAYKPNKAPKNMTEVHTLGYIQKPVTGQASEGI